MTIWRNFIFLLVVVNLISIVFGGSSGQAYYPDNGLSNGQASGVFDMPIYQGCKWYGTAPFCGSPDCPSGMEPSGMTKSCSNPNNHAACSLVHFGEACWVGVKLLCCPQGFSNGCRWYGTSPLCGGECPNNMRELARRDNCDNSRVWPCNMRNFGQSCTTGTKAYCCPNDNSPWDNPDYPVVAYNG
uniref:Uncharacterized protein n=1 Tax=Acrobeloides nanus TaxID=290746 RepID=A0A914DGJ4_9BILA